MLAPELCWASDLMHKNKAIALVVVHQQEQLPCSCVSLVTPCHVDPLIDHWQHKIACPLSQLMVFSNGSSCKMLMLKYGCMADGDLIAEVMTRHVHAGEPLDFVQGRYEHTWPSELAIRCAHSGVALHAVEVAGTFLDAQGCLPKYVLPLAPSHQGPFDNLATALLFVGSLQQCWYFG